MPDDRRSATGQQEIDYLDLVQRGIGLYLLLHPEEVRTLLARNGVTLPETLNLEVIAAMLKLLDKPYTIQKESRYKVCDKWVGHRTVNMLALYSKKSRSILPIDEIQIGGD